MNSVGRILASQIKIDLTPVNCAQHINIKKLNSFQGHGLRASSMGNFFWSYVQGEHVTYLHVVTSCLCDKSLLDKLFLFLSL